MRSIVGSIEGYDVIYLHKKDILFCKNTAVPYQKMKSAIDNKIDREVIKNDLIMHIDDHGVQLGCLTTTLENCKKIDLKIKKIKENERRISKR